jgi:hypothetical protein
VLGFVVAFDLAEDQLEGLRLHAHPAAEGVVEDGDDEEDQADGRRQSRDRDGVQPGLLYPEEVGEPARVNRGTET